MINNYFGFINYAEDEYSNDAEIVFYNVVFIQDFGKIKKDSKFDYVIFDFGLGHLIAGNNNDEQTIAQDFTLKPAW